MNILKSLIETIIELFKKGGITVENKTVQNPEPIIEKVEENKMQEQITENFTLSELTYSDTAKSKGIQNIPSEAEYANMKALCENVLQPLRKALGKPIKVNSCYRGKQLNEAVGGAKTSQHCKGQAADIEIMGMSNYDLACYIRDNMKFDQLILEFANNLKNDINSGWVHVSWNGSSNRQQCLTIDKRGTRLGIIK